MSTLELHPFPSFFPVETEENIIDQLSDCVPALRHCALTCRAWLPRSRFYLLRSVRIKSEKQLEAFSDMLDKYPNRRSWIASVTMAPTAGQSNPCRLLEAFPVALLANTQNLQRWEVNQSRKGTAARNVLYFHNVTLTRLRFSSIEELHLCSVQLGSHAELIRLLIAVVRLGSLKCTNVGFHRVGPPNLDSLKATARRRLVKLSTLMMQDMEPTAIILLLEVAQNVLANLDLFHIKGAKWDAIPLLEPTSLPVLSKLLLITFHWKQESRDVIKYLAGVFKSASGLTLDRLRWAPDLQSIGIQLHLDQSVSRTERKNQRTSAVSLGQTLALMTKQCLALEQALADLHLKEYIVSLHPPSQWIRSEIILRRRLEESFPGLHGKGLLKTIIHGGTTLSSMPRHQYPVIALTVSSGAKWIASGSRDGHIILWDAEHPMLTTVEWEGCVDSSQSFSFSPDSHRIVFPFVIRSDLVIVHVKRVDVQGSSSLLAALHIPDFPRTTLLPSVNCAWHHDGSKLSAAFFHRGHGAPVSACVWDATTYALLHVITDDPPIYANLYYPFASSTKPPRLPLVNCFLDGHWLVVVWFPPHWNKSGMVTLPMPQNMASTLRVWDVATGTLHAPVHGLQGDRRWSCSFTPIQDQFRFTVFCGDKASDWEIHGSRYTQSWPENQRTFPLSPDGLQRLCWSPSWFRVWDTHAHRCVAAFRCANVVGGCFSPDGLCIGVCSEDGLKGVLQVGRVSDGVLLGSFAYECLPKDPDPWNEHDDRVIAFSADGKSVYLGAPTGVVCIFRLRLPFPEPNAAHNDHTPRWERCDDEE